jgi:hypothetical protein
MSMTTATKTRPRSRVRPEPRPHRPGRTSVVSPSARAPAAVHVAAATGPRPVARLGLVLRQVAAVLMLGDLAS